MTASLMLLPLILVALDEILVRQRLSAGGPALLGLLVVGVLPLHRGAGHAWSSASIVRGRAGRRGAADRSGRGAAAGPARRQGPGRRSRRRRRPAGLADLVRPGRPGPPVGSDLAQHRPIGGYARSTTCRRTTRRAPTSSCCSAGTRRTAGLLGYLGWGFLAVLVGGTGGVPARSPSVVLRLRLGSVRCSRSATAAGSGGSSPRSSPTSRCSTT